jgi:hypothetical protein
LIQNAKGLNKIIWNFVFDCKLIQSNLARGHGIDQTLSRLGQEDYSPGVDTAKTEEARTNLK